VKVHGHYNVLSAEAKPSFAVPENRRQKHTSGSCHPQQANRTEQNRDLRPGERQLVTEERANTKVQRRGHVFMLFRLQEHVSSTPGTPGQCSRYQTHLSTRYFSISLSSLTWPPLSPVSVWVGGGGLDFPLTDHWRLTICSHANILVLLAVEEWSKLKTNKLGCRAILR